MAKRNKLNTANSSAPFKGIKPGRKREILGVLVIGVAILLGISILSYSQEDYLFARNISFLELFNSDASQRLVQNWLGPVGAYLSHFFVYNTFGYTSFILVLLIAYIGWQILRRRKAREYIWLSVLSVWAMVLLSTAIGWMNFNFNFPSSSIWSGAVGIAVSGVLQNFTNAVGSGIILLLLLLVTSLFWLNRDLQKSIDNLKLWSANMRGKWDGHKEKRAEKSQLRALRRREDKAREQASQRASTVQKQGTHKPGSQSGHSILDNAQNKIGKKDESELTINDILRQSEETAAKKREEEEKAEASLDTRQRALLRKDEAPSVENDIIDEDEIEVAVYKGEGDEEADERELDKINRDKAKDVPVIRYKFPTIDLLDTPPENRNEVNMDEIRENKRIILDKLKRHKIEIVAINAIVGPTVTLYELEPAPDVKISKIESYASDLKMATASKGLRMLTPIPGKSAVGIEVPNTTRETVYIKQVINTKKFIETKMALPVAFGKTIENEVFMLDLTKMPHLLMAGATGSGKSVGINTVITCLLYKCDPENLKFVMIDPKKIELSLYRNIQNHYLAMLPNSEEPIVTDTSKALETLNSVCKEMDDRYDLLKMALVRDIKSYNEKFKNGELEEELGHRHLPYIVVVIDELADLMMTAGKQIEEPIARIAQLARAIGIHLVVATQRPSVNVITGTIKANFPARIAYQVASKVDSRTILDLGGADQLVGQGDMLFASGAGMTRIQNAFVSTEEVERITSFIGAQAGYKEPFYLPVVQEDNSGIPDPLDDIDEMFEAAAKVVILHQQGSVSLLQRKLKIGYNRAGRIVDQLYNAGIVGPYQGSTARDVLISSDEELQEIMENLDL